MTRLRDVLLLLGCVLPATLLSQQPQPFTLEAYQSFLQSHRDLEPQVLTAMHPGGRFQPSATQPSTVGFLDSVEHKLNLTSDELALLSAHGFVVTERWTPATFGASFLEIYHNDLPVFISTDAILHALHMSYDAILKDVETQLLIPTLDTLLARVHEKVGDLDAEYAGFPAMRTPVKDLDLYLTVARKLLGNVVEPVFVENGSAVSEVLTNVFELQPKQVALFGSTARKYDFSQFKVRGHYTDTGFPKLGKYFQAMIWLSRTELYLIAPASTDINVPFQDVQRQILVSLLFADAVERSGGDNALQRIEEFLRYFVGEQDNVTLENLRQVRSAAGIVSIADLLDSARVVDFQTRLAQERFAFQRINSQILYANPFDDVPIRPAAAFLLLGQRFVVDSYVTGNVVYDRIRYQGTEPRRMLPSSLDVLFALGNNAAAQLLQSDLDRYHYATNLAALRFLIDGYDEPFWEGSIYNGWLAAIRALNPPLLRDSLPSFMQTAAWWQEKMNTQLASWAQLRHDNLLYAKQSYSGGVICSYPDGYVEPVPQFYETLHRFAERTATWFQQRGMPQADYFQYFGKVADTLGGIARKILTHEPRTAAERRFLQTVMFERPFVCSPTYDGWYFRLFYQPNQSGSLTADMTIADVHTAPTDPVGYPVGWVLHAGTGPVNLAVVTAQTPEGEWCAFVGPVMSYYEYLSTDFQRLTDEEWKEAHRVAPSLRPSFVYLYAADTSGVARAEAPSLLTSVDGRMPSPIPRSHCVLYPNYPNPFNSTTIISFSLGGTVPVVLKVFNLQGQCIRTLVQTSLSAGNYAVRWDGGTDGGNSAAGGVYFYRLTAGNQTLYGKMVMVK